MTQNEYDAGVTKRAEELIDGFYSRPNISPWTAHAQMRRDQDHENITEGMEKALVTGPVGGIIGGPFQTLPAVLLYCRWKDELPAGAIERIKSFLIEGEIERGNTENHWLMSYTAMLLAAEEWGDEEIFWNGLSPAAIHAEAKRWILGMIDRSIRIGHHEYDSTTYIAEHLVPLIGLVEHSRDDEIREKARLMANMHFLDMALEYFHGAWAGSHAREGYRRNTWTKQGPVMGLHYLYFGGEEFDETLHLQGFIGPLLCAKFRPDVAIMNLAAPPTKGYAVLKTKAPRNIYRHTRTEAQPVRKYTWMSPSFALGSAQIGLPGAPAGPIDLQAWDLSWDAPKHQGKICCVHPTLDPGRFSAFLSDFPQAARRNITTGKPYLQSPDRLFGASPYERLMQHKGALIALYRIPDNDETPFINLYLPRDYAWCEKDGWLTADMGGFYTAVYPIGPWQWLNIRESVNSAILVGEGDLIDGWLLRINDPRGGVILECIEANEAGNFDQWRRDRSAEHPEISGWPQDNCVGFSTSKGERLLMEYDGDHFVNDCRIAYENWPLYEAPGVHADLGSGIIEINAHGQQLKMDFEVDAAQALLPMRVIG